MSKIFSNLKYLRLQKGLSQEQLADNLGITRSRLGAYEENRNEPSIDLLITISDYFHVAVDALVRGDFSKTSLDGLMKIGKNRMLFPILIDEDGRDVVELVPLKASAGYLQGYGASQASLAATAQNISQAGCTGSIAVTGYNFVQGNWTASAEL